MPRLPVRLLIADEVMASRPQFRPIEGRAPYTFQRVRRVGGENFYDTIWMGSSQKYHVFDAALAWGLFPTWEGNLGTHEIRAASGLPYLCGRRLMEEQVYEYDGSEIGARAALRVVSRDLTETGEPWFERLTDAALANPLVQLGLEWVRSHPEAKTAKQGLKYDEAVRDELSRVLRRRAYELQLGMEIKRGIALFSYELLEFASDVDGREPA